MSEAFFSLFQDRLFLEFLEVNHITTIRDLLSQYNVYKESTELARLTDLKAKIQERIDELETP